MTKTIPPQPTTSPAEADASKNAEGTGAQAETPAAAPEPIEATAKAAPKPRSSRKSDEEKDENGIAWNIERGPLGIEITAVRGDDKAVVTRTHTLKADASHDEVGAARERITKQFIDN